VTPGHPIVGIAAFAVSRAGARTQQELATAPAVHSASAIKPLLVWAAAARWPSASEQATWVTLGRAAVTLSDNRAAAAIWSLGGDEALLATLNARIGLRWQVEGEGEHRSLGVLATALDLARGFAALAADDSVASTLVRRWMRNVPTEQTFGLRRVAHDTIDVDEGAVEIKCGWFGGARAHAVVMVECDGRIVGTVTTTTSSPTADELSTMRNATGDDNKLAAAHDALVGEHIRDAVRRGLRAAWDL
jgi:hypothetical protein